MVSMLYGRPPVVDALLGGGADVNTRTPTGWTALKEATFRNYPEVRSKLIAAGAVDYPDGSR